AEIDLDKVIQTPDKQRRRNLLRGHSAVLSGDFMNYWGQDKLTLVAETDADNLLLGVEEEGKTQLFKVEQRSKGLQWFLSFYLRLNARQEDINIILIDEPGLYLHAKAQQDVLKVLEKISEKVQVIFSTHSPYLIDADRLDRVRLLLKDKKNGTRVENKIQILTQEGQTIITINRPKSPNHQSLITNQPGGLNNRHPSPKFHKQRLGAQHSSHYGRRLGELYQGCDAPAAALL
ncbi:unnamed protein product, partial [marine sediment metagenome]